jgi:hypothetical protein
VGPIIKLKDFINEMEVFGDEFKAFLNIRTGEFVTLSEEDLSAAEEGAYPEMESWQDPDFLQKAIDVLTSEDFKSLPDKFEIHEYAIMRNFCYSVEEDELRGRLLNAIHGRGAFRYFKDLVFEHGIRDDWFSFREQAFKEIAIAWLESNELEYLDEKE